MTTTILNGLGYALRWLRDRHGRKQYQVAEAAGITKGMLSAYETGRQRPSLETLEKLLGTLGCDLNDLHNALQIINGRPEGMRRKDSGAAADFEAYPTGAVPASAIAEGRPPDVYAILGRSEPLPAGEEEALAEMLEGFHKLIRYFHQTLESLRRGPSEKAPE
jgi:transcriptional regulator with XRE-family HTH domain